MQTSLLQDTTTPSAISGNPWGVAGYNGGNFPDGPILARLFPHAFHMLIDVFFGQTENADACDAEQGDFTLPQAAIWLPKAKPLNVIKPVGYTSASNIDELVHLCAAQGLQRHEFFVWSAHYTGHPHICGPHTCGFPEADLTQFWNHQFNRNIDGSMCPTHGIFKEKAKVVLPPDPHHYRWFASSIDKHGLPGGPFNLLPGKPAIDERATVVKYDQLRKHELRNSHEIGVLKEDMLLLATRVMNIAYEQEHNAVVPWADFRRFGWRRDQLMLRADGHQLV